MKLLQLLFFAWFSLCVRASLIVQNLGGVGWTGHNENKCKTPQNLYISQLISIYLQQSLSAAVFPDLFIRIWKETERLSQFTVNSTISKLDGLLMKIGRLSIILMVR